MLLSRYACWLWRVTLFVVWVDVSLRAPYSPLQTQYYTAWSEDSIFAALPHVKVPTADVIDNNTFWKGNGPSEATRSTLTRFYLGGDVLQFRKYCSLLRTSIRTHGVDGAIDSLPVVPFTPAHRSNLAQQQKMIHVWHVTIHSIGGLAMEMAWKNSRRMRDVMLALQEKVLVPSQQMGAGIHGAITYAVYRVRCHTTELWPWIRQVCRPLSNSLAKLQCLHGTGHGMVLRSYTMQHGHDLCTPWQLGVPLITQSVLQNALSLCRLASLDSEIRLCMGGVYDSLFQNYANSTSPYYKCAMDTVDRLEALACFRWSYWYYAAGFLQLYSHYRRPTCLGAMRSETHNLACIEEQTRFGYSSGLNLLNFCSKFKQNTSADWFRMKTCFATAPLAKWIRDELNWKAQCSSASQLANGDLLTKACLKSLFEQMRFNNEALL